jgi:hypothetical protein
MKDIYKDQFSSIDTAANFTKHKSRTPTLTTILMALVHINSKEGSQAIKLNMNIIADTVRRQFRLAAGPCLHK